MKFGVAICHYNRLRNLEMIVSSLTETVPDTTRIVICDDGSEEVYFPGGPDGDDTSVETIAKQHPKVILVKGPNLGVAANKNRALFALQDCDYIAILEDDLMPTQPGWLETYAKAAWISGIHHFCRVQDKVVPPMHKDFQKLMEREGLNPIYGPSPRGDLTFITKKVILEVGGFDPKFLGAGHAHGDWSDRVWESGLIGHPNKWVDIQECRDSFVQVGDTEGGRFNDDEEEVKRQINDNAIIRQRNREARAANGGGIFLPLSLR